MQNPRLAARYAKSLLDLAVERNSLEESLNDMGILNALCRESRDFEMMLRSPIINGERKLAVIYKVMEQFTFNEMTRVFIRLLVTKGRESNLPEIASAFIAQYNSLKNIRMVKITTAAPVGDAVKNTIMEKVSGYMQSGNVNIEAAVDESLIGGFVLEMEDKLYDASVKKHLNDIRTKMLDYSYISKM